MKFLVTYGATENAKDESSLILNECPFLQNYNYSIIQNKRYKVEQIYINISNLEELLSLYDHHENGFLICKDRSSDTE